MYHQLLVGLNTKESISELKLLKAKQQQTKKEVPHPQLLLWPFARCAILVPLNSLHDSLSQILSATQELKIYSHADSQILSLPPCPALITLVREWQTY